MKKMTLLVLALLMVCVPMTALADADGSSVQVQVWGVEDYSARSYGNLNTSIDCVEGLREQIVGHSSTNWYSKPDIKNSGVWELDFRSSSLGGNDYRLTDDVDLAAYCGHGTVRKLELNTQRDSYQAQQYQMALGDRDCEWFLAFTCNFLNGSISQVGTMAKGIHAICGYATDMTVTANGGGVFIAQAMYGYQLPVVGAWYEYAKQTQPSGNTCAYFVAKNNRTDRLWGIGTVNSDPAAYTSGTAQNYELAKINI